MWGLCAASERRVLSGIRSRTFQRDRFTKWPKGKHNERIGKFLWSYYFLVYILFPNYLSEDSEKNLEVFKRSRPLTFDFTSDFTSGPKISVKVKKSLPLMISAASSSLCLLQSHKGSVVEIYKFLMKMYRECILY